jgi:hypothetical protein
MWAARPGVGLTKAARGDDTVIREQFNLVVEQDDTVAQQASALPGLIRHDPCCEVIRCRPLRAPGVDSGPCFLRSREQVSDCAATDAALRIDKTCRFTRAAHLQIRYLYEHTGEPIEPALRDTVHSLRQPSGNQIAPLPR